MKLTIKDIDIEAPEATKEQIEVIKRIFIARANSDPSFLKQLEEAASFMTSTPPEQH